jgi:enoyl-CoA hydratase
VTTQLEIATNGRLGLIALNRPEAINALSLEMIEGVTNTLQRWQNDDGVAAVLFTGNGPRGFCSGGDVRAMRERVLAGRAEDATAYFAAEYGMNGLIAGYAKPLIALSHGVVMGGGIGIAGHCGFRITQPAARFAMPESAIGFFADVGSNAILAKAPVGRALLFLMSGVSIGASDALALGLADAVIAPERLADIRAGLRAAAESSHPATAIVRLLEAESIVAGDAPFCAKADLLSPGLPESLEAFLAQVRAIPELEEIAALLETRSPSAMAATFHSQLEARRLMDVRQTLAMDLRLASVMARRSDFAEGVRAVLVDKDQKPVWQPKSLGEQDITAIADAIKGR